MSIIQNSLVPEINSDDYYQSLSLQFQDAYPDDILRWGYEMFGSKMVLGTGFGPSGMFLIHRIHTLELPISVFYLDTHLLFDETYELRDILEDRFNINITPIVPELSLKEQAEMYGDELWESDPDKCCDLRKVQPLRKYLSDKKGWITGVRRSQSKEREVTQIIEKDPVNDVVKINPLATWPAEKVWDYIYINNLPYNPLHDKGYPSIGCIPCTQPVKPGEKERAGRWRGSGKLECGIHISSQNHQKHQTNNKAN